MAEWDGEVGGSNICNVSPSDQAATLDNILSRLQRLETLISQHLGSNVQVEQLSDISNDLGWITNVTYLGQEGFTQTPAGTLIPPAGWTGFSDIINGETGLVSYAGGSPAGGGRSYKQFYTSDINVNSSNTDYIPPFSVQFASSDAATYFRWPSTGTWGNDGIDLLTASDHIYTANIRLTWSSAPSTGQVQIAIRRNRGGSVGTIQNYYFDAGLASVTGYYAFSITMPLSLQANDAVGLYIANGTNQTITAGAGTIYLEVLG